jgi:NTP pyrophosphatase (non-canonical NTP hydrolase)
MQLTFAEYAKGNRLRSAETFKRDAVREHAIAFTLGLCEEAGEVAGKVRAIEGITHRKAGTEPIEVAKEVGDVLAYLDLVAQSYGYTLEYCAQMKYNAVSERSGSKYRFRDGKLVEVEAAFKDVS